MNYENEIKKCEESCFLISMMPIEEVIRFGYSLGLNKESKVLDLCCGYGEVLKIWNEAFGISGTGVDIYQEFISVGEKRLREAGIDKVKLVCEDVLSYTDADKYDVVICSETFESIQNTLAIGEKFRKNSGVLVYHKVYSKVENPPQELVDFDGIVMPLSQLNREFNRLGYYLTNMASSTDSAWERYIMRQAKMNLENCKNNPDDAEAKEWMDKWYNMYFDYRRKYEGQALFGLEKVDFKK